MYKFFTDDELRCRCGCGKMEMNSRFMGLVIEMRLELDTPFNVTSAYRCPQYNQQVSSTGVRGPHTYGRALDIAAGSSLKSQILTAALARGMTRFGIGKNFIHIDDLGRDEGFPAGVIWTY